MIYAMSRFGVMSAPMRDPKATHERSYHHGDLRRGLVHAARKVLEAEGPAALSLRAVAREAGVSPAAPYHHFKDKNELLDAIAHDGWLLLDRKMSDAKSASAPAELLLSIGVAYVAFAREHPALYRVMYDAARNKAALPQQQSEGDSAYGAVRATMLEMGAELSADLELSTIAAWCGAHGLAEMAGFAQFRHLREDMGGEQAFIRAILRRMRVFPHRH
jgi:AcrR family transcriptional regulator